ncbi:phenylalanine--tRNA ligase subunit beta [Candidatus Uhrbacteria bacterium]|nr:phenylalanine--tRNA ligase subunit beta [Candidatus Uhrbacteria bacterium]
MNNLASYNWLKEYVKSALAPEDFAREISLRSMSVEKIDDVAARLDKCVVGLVNEVRAHPNADKLRIVTVNIGAQTVDVVCGGVNVAEGMKVCVALPGARVRWHGEGEYITLGETEIRGVKSVGMICGPSEVGFDALEKGDRMIWDLSDIVTAPAGTPLAEALGLDDVMFDIEITTNRPDAMGIVGLAREAGAATDSAFAWQPPSLPAGGTALPFSVAIDDPTRCFRQMAIVIDDVTVAPSPWWLQKRLLMAGVRPINNIVDITNYVLLEYAQPLHAFDYRAIEGGEIRVRGAKKGEKITLLNGKEYELDGELVLADAVKPLDVAGIMGGEHTGTTDSTKTVVLSASAFDGTSIRRTSRALNLQSDAQLLFEKGLSTEALPHALARAVALVREVAGGSVASKVSDVRTKEYAPLVFPLRPEKIRDRIGVDVSDERIKEILTQLGFTIDGDQVTVPWWRDHDIEDAIDLTEEVARIYGYHEMPSILPAGAPPTTQEPAAVTWERFTKRFLAASGYNEFYSDSFVSADDLAKYGLDPNERLGGPRATHVPAGSSSSRVCT